jgi:hypothetical protein
MSASIAFGTFHKGRGFEQPVFCLLPLIQERHHPPGDRLPPDRDPAQAMLDHMVNAEQDLNRPAVPRARSMPSGPMAGPRAVQTA